MAAPARISRADVIEQLVSLDRSSKRGVRFADLPLHLQRAITARFGTLARARQAARIGKLNLARKWSVSRVLRELRNVSRQGIDVSSRRLIETGRHDLMQAVYRHIGSLTRAREIAGVPDPIIVSREKQPWDEDRVVAEIVELHDKGRSIAYSKVEGRLVTAAARYFGTYKVAVEAAGIDYSKIRLRREDYTRQEILDLLRRLARRRPDLTLDELHGLAFSNVARRMFGSIEKAVHAAGVRGWPKRQAFPGLSRKAVIAKLRARRHAGLPVYSTAVAKAVPTLWRAALTHYATWRAALAAARIRNDSPQKRTWSRQLVIARLRERQRKGLSLRPTDVQKSDASLYATANRLFGSYRLAAKRVGVKTSKRRWTKAMVLRELRALAHGGKRLTAARTAPALVLASQKLFGAFSTACGAAGLEVHTKRKWSRDEVLRELRTLAVTGEPVKSISGLHKACAHYFGTTALARRAAG